MDTHVLCGVCIDVDLRIGTKTYMMSLEEIGLRLPKYANILGLKLNMILVLIKVNKHNNPFDFFFIPMSKPIIDGNFLVDCGGCCSTLSI